MSKFRLETRPSVLIIFLRRQFTLYFHSFFYTTSQYIAPRTCWILMDSEQLFILKMQTDLLLLMIRCRSHDSNLRQVPRPFLGRCAKGEAQGKRAQSYPRAISTLPVAEYQIAFPILVKHMLRTPHCPIAHYNQSSLSDSLAYVFPSIMISLHTSPCIII